MDHAQALLKAAQWIAEADGLIIAAGAGMGIDSGLPDFRGEGGFWKAYPGLQVQGYEFTDIANGQRFKDVPNIAWGFYGHRLNLYRKTIPHSGFSLLLQWLKQKGKGFVYSSNVDGQFQKAGFDPARIIECHGSIHYLQCIGGCDQIWPADDFEPMVDESSCTLINNLPTCPHCGELARPNIMMFEDWHWNDIRSQQQTSMLPFWREEMSKPLVIEIGAGDAVPTVSYFSKRMKCPIIRINPERSSSPQSNILELTGGALAILKSIAAIQNTRPTHLS